MKGCKWFRLKGLDIYWATKGVRVSFLVKRPHTNSMAMEMKAVVRFLGDLAHYSVTPEEYGIYHARLLKYEGPDGVTPPESVLLVKSARNWVGSYEESYFVSELGDAIEQRLRDGGDPASSYED